jgi:Cys-rich protein (TIGR01571 family)
MSFTSPSIYDFQHPDIPNFITFRNEIHHEQDTKPPITQHIIHNVQMKWNVGICDCCVSQREDEKFTMSITTCLKGFICPCVLCNEEYTCVQSCCKCCCCCCFRAGDRRRLRHKYGLKAKPCNDCCVICCCPCCSLVQEYNERHSSHKSPVKEIMKN